jgi:hypothetical protein
MMLEESSLLATLGDSAVIAKIMGHSSVIRQIREQCRGTELHLSSFQSRSLYQNIYLYITNK